VQTGREGVMLTADAIAKGSAPDEKVGE
jgi:hypothetical protein